MRKESILPKRNDIKKEDVHKSPIDNAIKELYTKTVKICILKRIFTVILTKQ